MRFLLACLSFAVARAEQTCTHGKLFVSDADSANIHVFDISTGTLENLTPETTLQGRGDAGINLDHTASGEEVAAIYRGTSDKQYLDGAVSFIDTGISVEDHGDHHAIEYGTPSLIDNANFDCARAIHFVRHDSMIAIFCDGSYGGENQVNSTVWVVDETKFGSTQESAVIFNTTLQGSHHGVAVPVDTGHIMYSLATPVRVNQAAGAEMQALPATFQVTDFQNNILHSIADTSSPDTSCSGFHGSSAIENTFALACDADHGGILIVDYAEGSASYKSRALPYPTAFEEHRTGSFAEHPMSEYIVGNFAGTDSYNLMAFKGTDTELAMGQILDLGEARQCAFALEHGEAKLVLVFMPTGFLHAFEFEDGAWSEAAKMEVVPGGVEECSDALFEPGVGQAFILHKDSKTLYAVDLEHAHEGELEVFTSTLSFTPFDAVVGGVPLNVACTKDGHSHGGDGHSHGGDGDNKDPGGDSSPSAAAVEGFVTLFAALVTAAAMAGW